MNIKLSFIRSAENPTGIGSNWIARVGHWVSRIPTNERNVWRRTPIRPPAIVIRRGQHRNAQCIVRRVLSLFLLFSSLSLSRCLFIYSAVALPMLAAPHDDVLTSAGPRAPFLPSIYVAMPRRTGTGGASLDSASGQPPPLLITHNF